MARISVLMAGGALALGSALAANGASATELLAVHGINGIDLGFDEELTVDIAIDVPDPGSDLCLPDVQFRDILGPLSDMAAGAYGVEIRLPDGATECEGTLVVGDSVSVSLVETALIVAHLDANGAPAVSKFTVNTSETGAGLGRLSAIHAAQAPEVDVEVENQDTGETAATFFDLGNGSQTFAAALEVGTYEVNVSPSDPLSTRTQPPITSMNFDAMQGFVDVGVIVGSVVNDTIETIPVEIEALADEDTPSDTGELTPSGDAGEAADDTGETTDDTGEAADDTGETSDDTAETTDDSGEATSLGDYTQ